jgi:hypothetical protein
MLYTDIEPQPWPANILFNKVMSVMFPATYVYSIASTNSNGNDAMKATIVMGSRMIETDATWKCSDTFHAYWTTIQFNDSLWQTALLPNMSNNTQFEGSKSQFGDATAWIWSKPGAKDAYCRTKERTCMFNESP